MNLVLIQKVATASTSVANVLQMVYIYSSIDKHLHVPTYFYINYLNCVCSMAWLIYAFVIENFYYQLSMGASMVLSNVVILYLILHPSIDNKKMKRRFALFLVLYILLFFGLLLIYWDHLIYKYSGKNFSGVVYVETIGFVCALFQTISYLYMFPNALAHISGKPSVNISLTFISSIFLSSIFWAIYAMLVLNYSIMIPNVTGIVLSVLQFVGHFPKLLKRKN